MKTKEQILARNIAMNKEYYDDKRQPNLKSYNQTIKEMRDEGIISTKEMVKMQTEALAKSSREASNLGNIEEQLEMELVNVTTLEHDIAKLESLNKENKLLIESYRGHFNADQKAITDYKQLLRRCAPLLLRNDSLATDLFGELLEKGLTRA